MADYAQ